MVSHVFSVFMILVIVYTFSSAAFAPSMTLNWTNCSDYGQIGTECAVLRVYLDQDNPDPYLMINSFVRRFYSGSAPTGNTIWAMPGGPGDSTTSFTGFAEVAIANDPSVTFYLVDPRGTGGSSFLSCDIQPGNIFNPYNLSSIIPYRVCIQQIMDKYEDDLPYYSDYHAARDFQSIVNAVNPTKIAIYALSCGTYFINQYLLLPGARVDVLVLDGPVAPTRWALENGAAREDDVVQDVLNVCTQVSATCMKYLDTMAQSPRLLMDSIIDGTLPCLANLPWLNQFSMSVIVDTLVKGGPDGFAALGPFWWRLNRCSESDVIQLNNYYETQYHTDGPSPEPADYSVAIALIVGSSELYSFAPRGQELDYDFQVSFSSRLMSFAMVQFFLSYAIQKMNFPRYTVRPELYRTYAKPTVPVLILVGTFDSNTMYGLGPIFQAGLSANNPNANVVLATVPYSPHGTLGPNTPCVQSIILPFLKAFGSQPADLSCLPKLPPPDFDGTQTSTQQFSERIFGTTNLWNEENSARAI